MAKILVTAVEPLPDDVLRVTGYVDGDEVVADGWQSAITNHYDADAYDKNGDRDAKAKPRAMTAQEARAYCEQLLAGAAPAKTPAAVKKVLAAVALDDAP